MASRNRLMVGADRDLLPKRGCVKNGGGRTAFKVSHLKMSAEAAGILWTIPKHPKTASPPWVDTDTQLELNLSYIVY